MTNTQTEPNIVRINVVLSTYEGDGWPTADEEYEQFVCAKLAAAYPDAVLDVSTAQGRTRCWAYEPTSHGNQMHDDVTDELRSALAGDWWDEFCALADVATGRIKTSTGTTKGPAGLTVTRNAVPALPGDGEP